MSKLIRYTLLFLLVVYLSSCVYYKVQQLRTRATMYSLAESFGYTPQSFVTQWHECLGPGLNFLTLSLNCEEYIVFTTKNDRPKFEEQLKQLGLFVRDFQNQRSASFYYYIRMYENHSLKINGKDWQLGSDFPELDEVQSYQWNINSNSSHTFTVHLYEFAPTHEKIEIDDKTINDNALVLAVPNGRYWIYLLWFWKLIGWE